MDTKPGSVLIIGINFYPEPTGIGKYTSELAFALAKKGLDVSVITGYPYYPHWKVFGGYKNRWYFTETIQQVKITRCPLYVPSSLSGGKRMLQDMAFFISSMFSLLGKMLKGEKFDLVFVPSPSFMTGFAGLFYSIFYRKSKFVYHIQDLQVDAAEELGMIKSGLLLRILKWGEGLILKNADWVSTISTGMQAKILAKPFKIKKQYLFPNWVDFGNIQKKEPNLSKIKLLGFPMGKKLCFYSGAVGEKQGLELLLEVAAKASVTQNDLVFVIAGSGPYAQVLKGKATAMHLDNLYFIELQPLETFNELLNYAFIHLVIQKEKASDLLLPSKLTNILAVEGLALITASPGTTLYNIVKDNEMGIVVPPDDPEAFWRELNSIYHDPGRAQLLKSNAGKYAFRYLQKDTIIESFLEEVNLAQPEALGK
jgi:colanic acid biosynthesis glycosyl transferase WcaI